MPIHDWTRVPSGLFHEFHQSWSVRLKDALNAGILGSGYYAMVEQKVDGPEPDVIAVQTGARERSTGTATLAPPRTRQSVRFPTEAAQYARRANRISIVHPIGEVVAVIEIVSPGNKDSRHALRSFVDKAVRLIRSGIHLLIVDLFPPHADRDPQGLHGVVWEQFTDEPFALPPDKPLTLVSYQIGGDWIAHLDFVAVGDALPDMPLFVTSDEHVLVPLEATYQSTWAVCPEPIRQLVLGQATPSPA